MANTTKPRGVNFKRISDSCLDLEFRDGLRQPFHVRLDGDLEAFVDSFLEIWLGLEESAQAEVGVELQKIS